MDKTHYNAKHCEYCRSFHPSLWKFVNLYLDQIDIDKFQSRDVIQYYKNLINHFLETEFHWENGKLEAPFIAYKKVKNLPYKVKANAVDCLGTVLGIGPKTRLEGVSYLYDTYLRNFSD
jgi:thiol-disulfide isomerase/thioredoxin